MSLLLYLDEHVPAAIARGLRERGIDVVSATEDGCAGFSDEQLLERARTLKRVLFTQDADFLSAARQWLDSGRNTTGVVYAHQLRITIGQAVRDLELLCNVLDPIDIENRVEFLPLV